ncbi:GPI-anchored protein LLG1-like [Aegilops tauschii subsp. strangulata]|uniref:GPI-anchored protein LLG1-like n=1 Tax=Aegilops tauschii subsp. strangulata TaxID=200361 RepID=UPI003CC8CC1D
MQMTRSSRTRTAGACCRPRRVSKSNFCVRSLLRPARLVRGMDRLTWISRAECPVTFEGANYTLITSKCKGPLYQPALCCAALAEFACPYDTYINDLATNCAATMFSLIHLYGKYPAGLFANTCKGDNLGLKCPEDVPQVQPGEEGKSSAAVATAAQGALVAASAAVMSLLIVMS